MNYAWETQLRKNEECKKVVKYSNLSVQCHHQKVVHTQKMGRGSPAAVLLWKTGSDLEERWGGSEEGEKEGR